MKNFLIILNKKIITYYICGDTNINLLQNETNYDIKNYSDMLFSLGCLPLVKFPTRISNTSSTFIDHIYTNNILEKNTTHTLINDLYDHLPAHTSLHSFKNTAKVRMQLIHEIQKNFNSDNFLVT